MPGFFRSSWLVAAKDLRMEWKTFERLVSMALFSLVVMVIFNFAFDLVTIRRLGASKLVPGVLWITLAFSGIIGFTRSFQLEHRRDSMIALMLAPADRGAIFLGKMIANLTTVWILQIVIVPLSAVFFNYDLVSVALPMAVVMGLHTIGIAELGTLFAAVATRLGRGEALLATLLLPTATPLFLSAVKCTEAVLEHETLGSMWRWLAVTSGLNVLYLLVALATFEYVLED
jgi:heme exporter protein B